MVLINAFKKIYICIILFDICVCTHAQTNYFYEISGLAHYKTTEENNSKLELVEENSIIRPIGRIRYDLYINDEFTQEYIIRNNGEETTEIMGIFVADKSSHHDKPMPDNLQFYVDGVMTDYTIKLHETLFEKDGKSHDQFVNWGVIEVKFQKKSAIKIEVHYTSMRYFRMEDDNGILYYNKLNEGYENYTQWNGLPQFFITITNDYCGESYPESNWITNIDFQKKCKTDNFESLQISNMLIYMLSLENDLFVITKINDSSWRIQFKKKFVEEYSSVVSIKFSTWSGRGGYCYLNIPINKKPEMLIENGLSKFDSCISMRKLAPFELIFLTKNQLRIMRNAFYAQYGYIFQDKKVQSVFESDVYEGFLYRPNPNFSESMLTDIDRANIETIRKLEEMKFDTEEN